MISMLIKNIRDRLSKATIVTMCIFMLSQSFYINKVYSETTSSEAQISNYYDEYSSEGKVVATSHKEYEDGDIKIDKEISATNTENEFDISLKVESKNEANKIFAAEDAAVVLVLDVSTSISHDNKKSIIDACNTFINNFSSNNNGSARYISLVTFSQQVNATDWIDISNSNNKSSFISTYFNKNNINANFFNYKTSGELGGTNTYGGLEYAYRCLLKDTKVVDGRTKTIKDVPNKYVILMTDGVPNTITVDDDVNENSNQWRGLYYTNDDVKISATNYKNYELWHKETQLDGEDGTRWYDLNNFKKESGAENYSTDWAKGDPGLFAAALAKNSANKIKEKGIDLYAIGFGNDLKNWIIDPGATTKNYKCTNGKYINISGKTENNGIVISSGDKTVKTGEVWLKTDIASENKYYVGDVSQIATNLDEIFKKISNEVAAWIVEDPMGDNIEFKYLYGANNTSEATGKEIVNKGVTSIETKTSTQGVVSIVDGTLQDNKIVWDLKLDTTHTKPSPYVYTLKYRVKLNNLFEGFKSNTDYKANKDTTILYGKKVNGIDEVANPPGTFNIPSVKGYLSGDSTDVSFSLTKKDDINKPISGVTFTLTTNDDKDWKMSAESGEDGVVSFGDIPSGHTYILKETDAPDNYTISKDTYTVNVNYGVVEIFDKNSQKVDLSNFVVTNVPTSRSVTIKKVWDDGNDQDGKRPKEIKVQLYQTTEGGSTIKYEDPILITGTNDVDVWTKTIDELPAFTNDTPKKKLTYFVKELNGDSEIENNGKYDDVYTEVKYTDDNLTITNTHTPETTSIKGQKV